MPKRQIVNATIDLIIRDEKIAKEHKILEDIKLSVRRGITGPRAKPPLIVLPALYKRYRRRGLPLKNRNGRRLPAWRSLSPWMRAQMVSLVIGEHEHRQFRVRLHDDVATREIAKGTDLKSYLRNRITRVFKDGFEQEPWYIFVIEDLATDGTTLVRPHAHGVIRIRALPLSEITNKRSRAAYARRISTLGQDSIEMLAGIKRTRHLLNQASGNSPQAPQSVNGVSQKANVWMRSSYHRFFNDEAISYAFKNTAAPASHLPQNRLAISRGVLAEAKRFWELIRRGESAMSQWT